MKLPALTLLVALAAPITMYAHEEKTVSMEAIMEELATLRTLVEAQQRQIEQLQAAVTPGLAAAPVAQAQPANAQAGDLEKKVDTLSTNLAGFKFSGDFRLRADVQAHRAKLVAGPL